MNSGLTPSLNRSLRETIRDALHHCRLGTLAQFDRMDEATFSSQPHPDFSPPGWHLGHIAYTEALWLLQHGAGMPPLMPEYHRLLAADGLPKSDRVHLPSLPDILDYLQLVRDQVFAYLDIAPIEEQLRLWYFILQHECQHSETIAFITHLTAPLTSPAFATSPTPPAAEMQLIPAGEFIRGHDGADALDNERVAHRDYLEAYEIDRYPVTCGEFREFMVVGGYRDRIFWSDAGWEWLQADPVTKPLYWSDNPDLDNHPVCGVSWYEAQAYAQFAGKRLPTEAEWEKAARWNPITHQQSVYPWGNEAPTLAHCNCDRRHAGTTPVDAYANGVSACGCYDLLGNVWEWTASWFDGYPGFQFFPYPGYSRIYFDGEHRVLKGGSWVTRLWTLRSSFRNWYHPHVRQIYAGFRCAR